jgi:hypothetical protein
MILETFFLAEEKRSLRTQSFQDLLASPAQYPGRVSVAAAQPRTLTPNNPQCPQLAATHGTRLVAIHSKQPLSLFKDH